MSFVVDAHTLVDPYPMLQRQTRRTLSAPHSHYSGTVDQLRASKGYESTHRAMVIILQHAAVAYPAMMGPLASRLSILVERPPLLPLAHTPPTRRA